MPLTSETIDRIVANVLSQVSTSAVDAPPVQEPREEAVSQSVSLNESVITAELVEALAPATSVTVLKRAIVTPAAWDAIQARRVKLLRGEQPSVGATTASSVSGASSKTSRAPLLIVVRHTPAIDQVWDDLKGAWKKDLQGCPDDAAKLAISSICRGEASQVVILAEQTHRAACLANRNEKVKAVAVSERSEIKAVRKQLRANVWCIDPTGRAYFERKNLLRQLWND